MAGQARGGGPQIKDAGDVFIFLIVCVLTFGLVLVWAVVKRPMLGIPVACYVGLVWLMGPENAQALVVWGLLALVVWAVVHRKSFRRVVLTPVRDGARRQWVYGGWRWRRLMLGCGLGKRYEFRRDKVPKVLKVERTEWVERVTVRMLRGHSVEQYQKGENPRAFASACGSERCRVRPVDGDPKKVSRLVMLEFVIKDPLTKVVEPCPFDEEIDLLALPVGLAEDGLLWRVQVLWTHILVAGTTGAGKGSVLWSIIRALAPGVKQGIVKLRVLDPKGGVELGAGDKLFDEFSDGAASDEDEEGKQDFTPALRWLEATVREMRRRAKAMREEESRMHWPTREEPLIVVIVDEMANITTLIENKAVGAKIMLNLNLLLTQGRGLGISVIAALQDPRKETLPNRDLFQLVIALRLRDKKHVNMILGDGARESGAECDKISAEPPELSRGVPNPRARQGTAYVMGADGATAGKVRASWISNQTIREVVEDFRFRGGSTGGDGGSAEDFEPEPPPEPPVADSRPEGYRDWPEEDAAEEPAEGDDDARDRMRAVLRGERPPLVLTEGERREIDGSS